MQAKVCNIRVQGTVTSVWSKIMGKGGTFLHRHVLFVRGQTIRGRILPYIFIRILIDIREADIGVVSNIIKRI